MSRSPRRLLPLLVLAALAAPPAVPAPAREANPAETEAALDRVKGRIREVTEAVQGDVARRDGLARELKSADEALQAARRRLDDVRSRRSASEARLAELKADERRAAAELAAERAALAAQLRSAYQGGRDEELKVLLNAADPATLGRMLTYYGYLGRARADRIHEISARAARLEALDEALAGETAKLAALEDERRREAGAVDAARGTRQRALGELQARIASRSAELKDLKANASSLEDLLARLRAALEDFDSPEFVAPGGARRPFADVHGRLSWPARGRLLAQFGEARAAGLKWQGLLLETHRAGEIRAPYYGRVVYADWLPGLGLLMILDHGGGYLSLYGYNEKLYRQAGDKVRPGEVIAASFGDGAARPELYFEIRQGARPLDPRPWLKGTPRP
ncbi:MAG: peptidoglycan DD-metalloendopeptidase family protein [Proteobacteria bacterium]|nr:peptidoglycan DD-metalloendopeptidase family protein [Pseudomonadota bacterium]